MKEKLIMLAKETMNNAYAPYSGYKVGAAVEDESGNVFTGCNIENASYGATICAERTAIFNAVSNGSKRIKRIAIASEGSMPYPCGMCRQVMTEFMDENAEVTLEHKGVIEIHSLGELIPFVFKI